MTQRSKRLASERNRNTKARVVAVALAAATAGLVIFGRWEPKPEGIEKSVLVRGDRSCYPQEAYPYKHDENGKVMKDEEGNPIKNPHYSKEDCHKGDNVCDNGKEVFDPEGNQVTDLMKAYVKGKNREITLPLEDENSPDCLMAAVVDKDPCAEFDGENLLARPRVTRKKTGGLRQRTQKEIEELHAGDAELGDNYHVTRNDYEEVCPAEAKARSEELELCTATSTDRCLCPNLDDCNPDAKKKRAPKVTKKEKEPAPEPPKCGNGKIDEGEECDPKSIRDTCGSDAKCTSSCTCEDKAPSKPGGPCGSIGDSQVLGRLATAMQGGGGAIRDRSGASNVPVVAFFTVSYAPGRGPQLLGSYLQCAGKKCPNNVDPAAVIRVDLTGAQVTGVTDACTKTYPVPAL